MKAKFSIIAAVLALVGCGDNNIDTVKNYTLPQKKINDDRSGRRRV